MFESCKSVSLSRVFGFIQKIKIQSKIIGPDLLVCVPAHWPDIVFYL